MAVLAGHGDVSGNGKAAARHHLAQGAGFDIDLLDAVVGHVGDKHAVVSADGDVVQRAGELGDLGLAAGLDIDGEQLAALRGDHIEHVPGVELGGGRGLEAVGDHGDRAGIGVDLDHLVLEPQWAVEHAVGSRREAVEPADRAGDGAGWFDAFGVKLPHPVALEDLTEEQAFAVAAEGDGIGPGHVLGQHRDRAVADTAADEAGRDRGPDDLAAGAKSHVIGHALRRLFDDANGPGVDIDAVEGLADHAAGIELARRRELDAVDTLEGGALDQFGDRLRLGGLCGTKRQNKADTQSEFKHATLPGHSCPGTVESLGD